MEAEKIAAICVEYIRGFLCCVFATAENLLKTALCAASIHHSICMLRALCAATSSYLHSRVYSILGMLIGFPLKVFSNFSLVSTGPGWCEI